MLLAVSLANLCFYGVWHQLLFAQPFYMPLWSWRDLLAITLNVSALAALFWMAITRRRAGLGRGAWHWSSCLFLLPAMIFLNLLRLRYWMRLRAALDDDWLLALLGLLATLLCAYVLARWPRKILAGAEVLTLWLFAFVPMTLGQTAWMLLRQPQLPATALAAALPASPLQPRVVWIVFDEMDWRPVFGQPALALPELDRLRAQSLDVAPAIQTGIVTAPAMASLIYGRQVYDVQPTGHNELQLNFVPHGEFETWRPQHSLLARARQAGFNTAVVGWFLPYCRMFAADLTRCYWESMYAGVLESSPSLLASLRNQWLTLSPLEERQRHLRRHHSLMREAQRAVADPNLGFVLVHLAVPHQPAIYDRHNGGFTAVSFRKDWYLDNLALADRSLGELRHAMESAGLWDRTTVLVTSDHSLRYDAVLNPHTGPQVPFLLKLAGQQGSVSYQRPTSTLAAHDLTLALLRGELFAPREVTDWLDRRVSQSPKGVPPPSQARD